MENDALNERRILKRNLSLAKGEETAVPIEWKYPWDAGAPCPHVLADGHRVFLAYCYTVSQIALVEFIRVVNFKFGGPNDEVLHGHPLYGHGLEYYEAHEIINSKWIIEQEQINAVHSRHDSERWQTLKHFVFTFHDEIFECIAEAYNVEIINGSFRDALCEATKWLFDR